MRQYRIFYYTNNRTKKVIISPSQYVIIRRTISHDDAYYIYKLGFHFKRTKHIKYKREIGVRLFKNIKQKILYYETIQT